MSFIKAFEKFGKWVGQHSSQILTVIACSGAVLTAYDSVHAGARAVLKENKMREKKAEAGEEVTNADVIKATWTEFINPTIDIVITLSAIILLYNTDAKKQANLASALTAMTAKYENFKATTRTRVGEELYQDIEMDILKDTYCGEKVFHTTINKGERKLFWEPITQQFFTSTEEDIAIEYADINRMLVVNGAISLNDYLMYLGLPEVDYGWGVGWSEYGFADYGYKWIDIGVEEMEVKTKDQYYNTVYKLIIPFEPHSDFLEG